MNIWAKLIDLRRNIQRKKKYFIASKLLAHLGEEVYIHPSVTLNWPEKISIGKGSKIYKDAFLNCRSSNDIGMHIGKGVKIHQYTYVDPYGGCINLEDNVGIGHHCVIGGHGGLKVKEYTKIAGLTYVIPANHIFQRKDIPYIKQGETKEGIEIGSNVWIGAGCLILDGVKIGDNAVIGAGSVVSRSIPKNVLALGTPAEVVRKL